MTTGDQPRTYPPGVTCWVDAEQPDVDAATAFYGGLLGWQFTNAMPPEAPGRYVIATLGGRDVAAIGSGDDRTWNTYVAVAERTPSRPAPSTWARPWSPRPRTPAPAVAELCWPTPRVRGSGCGRLAADRVRRRSTSPATTWSPPWTPRSAPGRRRRPTGSST